MKWLLALFLLATPAVAQDIPKGLGHPPEGAVHWYEQGCCNKQDCEPVEPFAIIETAEGYAVKYLTSRGFVAEGFLKHGDSGIRQSRDKQEHACATPARVLCIYIHLGV